MLYIFAIATLVAWNQDHLITQLQFWWEHLRAKTMLKIQFKTLDRDILHLIVCPLHMTQRPPSLVQIQMANGFQAKEILMRRRKKIKRKKKQFYDSQGEEQKFFRLVIIYSTKFISKLKVTSYDYP